MPYHFASLNNQPLRNGVWSYHSSQSDGDMAALCNGAARPLKGKLLSDKKPISPEAWNINFDTERGIFYYLGIFLHLFKNLPPSPSFSCPMTIKSIISLQLTLQIFLTAGCLPVLVLFPSKGLYRL